MNTKNRLKAAMAAASLLLTANVHATDYPTEQSP